MHYPKKKKKYFKHRVATFIDKYEFIGKENFQITNEVKLLIAATSTMLTFGMRNYLYKIIDKIIVFPTIYYSSNTDQNHKGEFNPMLKAIVFSWEHFLDGFKIPKDNLNLGFHEFTHVLHFECLKFESASGTIFVDMHTKLMHELTLPETKQKLIDSSYFRIYAYTNQFEFLSVLIEHFFETPENFNKEFPELYNYIAKMLNFKQ